MLKIKLLREEAGMTQKEMALKLNTSNKNIWAYENGNAEPNIDMLKKIADLFDVSIDYLVERVDDFGTVQNKSENSVNISKFEKEILLTVREYPKGYEDEALRAVKNGLILAQHKANEKISKRIF